MHEKRKKYYHIRKDLFWYTILLAVSFLIGYAIHQHHGIFLTHSLKADAPKERIEITFDDLQSSLKDISTCNLCGSSDYSMMDYYRKFDTVGLISLNDWYVLDFQLKAYDENGNEIDPTVKVKITVNDETVYSDSNRKDETEIISEISGKGTVTVKVWVNEIKKITKQFDLSVDDPVLTID